MWVQKAVQSKFIKCFLIAIVLVFSYEVSKPKAIAPLAWAGYVLAGMAAETLITAGVKAGSKAVLKKQADNFSAQASKNGNFEFLGSNPYRNKDGSISLTPKANDRAKMAGLIGGALTGLMLESADDVPPVPTGGTSVPIVKNTDANGYTTSNDLTAYEIAKQYTYAYKVTDELGNINVHHRVKLTDAYVYDFPKVQGHSNLRIVPSYTSGYCFRTSLKSINPTGGNNTFSGVAYGCTGLGNQHKGDELAKSVGEYMVITNNIIFPSTVNNIYPVPMNMSSTYTMPNNSELENKPLTFENICPASETEGIVTWEELDQCLVDSGRTIEQAMAPGIDKYLERGIITDNMYVIDDIENFYTDKNYSLKVPEFNPELDDTTLPEVPAEGEEVSELDHSMWQVMKNTYNYLDDGIDASLASMKGITDSAQGITNYLNQTMGWLPMEFRAVLTSAFVLGVFAHFLRR